MKPMKAVGYVSLLAAVACGQDPGVTSPDGPRLATQAAPPGAVSDEYDVAITMKNRATSQYGAQDVLRLGLDELSDGVRLVILDGAPPANRMDLRPGRRASGAQPAAETIELRRSVGFRMLDRTGEVIRLKHRLDGTEPPSPVRSADQGPSALGLGLRRSVARVSTQSG